MLNHFCGETQKYQGTTREIPRKYKQRTTVMINEFVQGDAHELIKEIPDESVDIVLSDPPYMYLSHKLDRKWDEDKMFDEFSRVLKPNSFICLFGRGASFYRWNTKLINKGWTFKEEIIWDKCKISSPVLPVARVHETVAILARGNAVVHASSVPYVETHQSCPDKVLRDLTRICSILKSPEKLEQAIALVDNGTPIAFTQKQRGNNNTNITVSDSIKARPSDLGSLTGIIVGQKEKDIISITRRNNGSVHPTEKPVRLLERLIALMEDGTQKTILDPFGGSGSTAIAAINRGHNFYSMEIDETYFNTARDRIQKAQAEYAKQQAPQQMSLSL